MERLRAKVQRTGREVAQRTGREVAQRTGRLGGGSKDR